MDAWQGISLNEGRLLAEAIGLTVLVAVSAVVLIVSFVLFWQNLRRDPKEKQRTEKLKTRMADSEQACREYNKRQRKRKRKRHVKKLVRDLLIEGMVAVLLAVEIWFVSQNWLDYTQKDYAVYTGSYTVEHRVRTSWVELADGTRLRGYAEGTYGTIVYAHRSEFVVGYQTESAEQD